MELTRIPARCDLKSLAFAGIVVTLRDVVEDLRIGIEGWIRETDSRLASKNPLPVDPGQDTGKDWA